jgi:NAD(P)-dependent dehydrogenase (short-subunit alcohol dehydrogenase family)
MNAPALRVAVVTGVGSGIGAAVVAALLEAQYRVVGVDIDGVGIAQSAERLSYVVGDVADPATWARTGAAVGGPLEALINVAAVRPTGPATEMSVQEWRRCLDVNLVGAAGLIGELAPMLRDDGAVILNVASGAAFGKRHLAAYGASKAGLISYSRALATELAPRGIRVNAIVPGTTKTKMQADARRTGTGADGSSAPRNFGGNVLSPAAIADDIVAVMAMKRVTGAVIPIGLLPWEW